MITVSTRGLSSGDAVFSLGGRVVESVSRDMSNLDAMLIRFTDGSHFHAGIRDAHHVIR